MKLVGQFAAAAIPVWCEVRVTNVTLPFIDPLELGDWSYPLTLVGIVAVMNVVNFTDGADGLAAGVCTIAAGTFAIIALSLDRDAAGVLAALTAGAAIGFLWHNFHPASIFMGDAGSNLLGLLLACVAIQGVLKTAAVVALFFPLLILAVPALDATFVVAKRIKYGRPVYSADRWHFHHRFANIGFSQRRTVLYLYGWTLSLAALALAMRFVPYSDDDGTLHVGWTLVIVAFALIAVAASVYLVIVLEILKFRRFRERELRRQVETGEIAALSAVRDRHRDRARGGDRRVPRGASARDGRLRGRHLTCCSAGPRWTASGRGRSRLPFAGGTARAPAPGDASARSWASWRSTRWSLSNARTSPPPMPPAPATRPWTSCSPSSTSAATPRSGASSCTGPGRTPAARCASRPTSSAPSWSGCANGCGASTAPAATGRGRARRST